MALVNQQIKNIAQADLLFPTHFITADNSFAEDIEVVDSDINFTKRTNTEIVGTDNNGIVVKFKGNNLLNTNATINEVIGEINNVDVFTFSGGSLNLYGSGELTDFSYRNTLTGAQATGNVSYDIYNLQVSQYAYDSNIGFTYSLEGDLFMYYTDSDLSGYIQELSITLNGQTDTFSNLNLNYAEISSTETTYSSLLNVALSGDDTITASNGNDVLNGFAGNDTLILPINTADITMVRKAKLGGILIESSEGSDRLYDIENISTLDDGLISLASLLTDETPSYATVSNNNLAIIPEQYTGPVAYLEYSMIGDQTNEVIIGSNRNDFMNLLGGDDAANGGAGDDVLDGGIGSNFLTGGGNDDTFFLDGRSGEVTWSTVTDFSSDEVNIWGWEEGTSQILLKQIDGVEGYTGATLHIDLDEDNSIDTSITLTGLSLDEMPTSSALSVAGNGYLLIA